MEANDADVFLSSTLLRFYESSRTVNANDETASDLGVECSTVSRFFNPEKYVNGDSNKSLDKKTYFNIRLSQATTSWLEGLEGLSKLITPELM